MPAGSRSRVLLKNATDFRLECHSLDSCYPRSKIQDFQKAFLGNLGINPRSKIQDSQNFFLGCRLEILDAPKIQDPRFPENFSWKSWKSWDKPKIQDLGCIQDSASASKKSFLELLDLGSWVYPKISKKSFLEILDLGSWVAGIETMTLKSEVKSELKSELMSQETQYKKPIKFNI